MPWPVTHILTAEIYYDPFFSHLDHKSFIIGTCFSDIRYPARLSRSITHPKNLSLSDIQAKPAFHAGLSFHSFVDEIWNQFVLQENHHIFDDIPHNKPMIHTMKVLQDKYLYNKSGNWSQINNYFEGILPEEKDFGVSREMVERWHSLLAFYLSKPPNIDDLEMLSISLDPAVIDKIEDYYLAFLDHQPLKWILLDFYDRAAHLFQDNKTTWKL